jgi:hypothetical protein
MNNPMQPVGPRERAELVSVATWMADHKMIPSLPDVAEHIVDLTE